VASLTPRKQRGGPAPKPGAAFAAVPHGTISTAPFQPPRELPEQSDHTHRMLGPRVCRSPNRPPRGTRPFAVLRLTRGSPIAGRLGPMAPHLTSTIGSDQIWVRDV
jgi:hypothetical protein